MLLLYHKINSSIWRMFTMYIALIIVYFLHSTETPAQFSKQEGKNVSVNRYTTVEKTFKIPRQVIMVPTKKRNKPFTGSVIYTKCIIELQNRKYDRYVSRTTVFFLISNFTDINNKTSVIVQQIYV